LELANEESSAKISALKAAVKEVNGTFISVFHNQAFCENAHWKGWSDIYKKTVI